MTIPLLKKICNTQTNDVNELYNFAQDLFKSKKIEPSAYASLKAHINQLNPNRKTLSQSAKRNAKYSEDEVLTVTQSHLDVYDGKKAIQAHLNLMRKMFGESSSQFRNGVQYNKSFHRTLDLANPNLGQSMPANWAEATLVLIQNRKDKTTNVLKACKAIYEQTNNGNMYKVVQKWSTKI